MNTLIFKITNMHCSSCAMNIDGELEDTAGIISANTNYAKQQTQVTYQPPITSNDIINIIKKAGYNAILNK